MTDSTQVPLRVLEDALRAVAATLNDIVPPEAQMHFLAAQRELLLGVATVIEHNTQRPPRGSKTGSKTSRRRAAAGNRPSRVKLD